MLIVILLFFSILFVLPAINLLILFVFKNENFLSFLHIVFFRYNKIYYSNDSNNHTIHRLVFLPHPYLNWSLNPNYKNIYGELVHTKEGFRKTLPYDSIIKYLEDHPKTYKIICIGGSSTHCMEMDRYEDTWPALIQKNLKTNNYTVINFGVGAWTTMQSLIRCTTWFPIIKPNMLIFYHAKNDLTPLVNGNLNEKFVYPDYQNVITQFTERYITGLPKIFYYIPLITLISYLFDFKKNKLGLLGIYKPNAEENPIGMKRLNKVFFDSVVFRHKTILDICKKNDCFVMYIPEIVKEGIYRETLINKIFPKIKNISEEYDNVEWFDLDKLLPNTEEFFLDKMHFSAKGNKLFSKLIANKIIELRLNKK